MFRDREWLFSSNNMINTLFSSCYQKTSPYDYFRIHHFFHILSAEGLTSHRLMCLIVKPFLSTLELVIQVFILSMELFGVIASIYVKHAITFDKGLKAAFDLYSRKFSILLFEARVGTRLVLSIFCFSFSSPLTVGLYLVSILLKCVKI